MENYDLIVIGFGKAGKTLAAKAASLGKKVALVEKDANMYGGTCINVGCIPSKKLLTLSKDAKFFEDKKAYFKKAMESKNTLISALRAKNFAMLDDLSNVDVLTGTASFKDDKTVEVVSNGTTSLLSAKNIIINTGSTDVKPNFEVNSSIAYNSAQFLSIKELPSHLVIVGGGFIGLEMASIFANFGSKVTVLSKTQLFKQYDEDIRKSAIDALKAQGIEIIEELNIDSIKDSTVHFTKDGKKEIKADAFLISIGRVANTFDLKLSEANIKTDARGNIEVNEYLQTNKEHIYAVGDVKGGDMFTFVSLDDFRIVFDHLFGKKQRTTKNRNPYARVVFLDTPIASIGLSANDAKKANIEIRELVHPMMAVPGAKILGNDKGLLKAIVDKNTSKILGATFHAVEAHEIINQVALAMSLNLDSNFFKNDIFTHPSIHEALNDLFSK